MHQRILDYLDSQRVGVMVVVMPDGSAHAATVHFGRQKEPVGLLIATGAGSIKGKALMENKTVKASFVVGVSEETMITFQADGMMSIVEEGQRSEFDDVYLNKFPEKAERLGGTGTARAIFTPTWWRFSNLKDPENKIILISE